MNDDICRMIWTPERIQARIDAIPPDVDSYNPMFGFMLRQESQDLTTDRHIWKDLRSGVFDSKLVGKECIKCGKIVPLL